jgi:hypothetical protein
MRHIIRLGYRLLNGFIPHNQAGDHLVGLIWFVICHRRVPRKSPAANTTRIPFFNDYLFNLKTGPDGLNPLRAFVSDKAWLKNYVAAKVGPSFNVPSLCVLYSFEEALAHDFPERCCIKPTHMSGAVIFRLAGEPVDFGKIRTWFQSNYYLRGREANYRHLKPKLIVEPLIFDSDHNEDLKFFCHRGKAKFVQVDIGRRTSHTRLYFDRNWSKLAFSILKPISAEAFERPKNWEQLLGVADALSQEFEFVRVDLYTNGSEILVGEITNWPENCNGPFIPKSAELQAAEILFKDIAEDRRLIGEQAGRQSGA